jgi:hypothetical protein
MANKKYNKIVDEVLNLLDSDKPVKSPEKPERKEPEPFEHIPEKKETETTEPSKRTKTDPVWPEKD